MTLAAVRLRERNATTAAPAFSPATMTGIQAWWDFSTLALTDGTAIPSISDGSANGRTASQATGTKQPLCKTGANGINGLPVALFDGVDDVLTTASFSVAQPFTVYAVLTGPSTDAGPPRFFAGVTEAVRIGGSTTAVNLFAGSALTVVASWTAANPKTATYVVNGSSSLIRVNGTQVVAGAAGASGLASGVALGASAIEQFWGGKIGEVFFTNTATADPAAEAYLKAKWGTP